MSGMRRRWHAQNKRCTAQVALLEHGVCYRKHGLAQKHSKGDIEIELVVFEILSRFHVYMYRHDLGIVLT